MGPCRRGSSGDVRCKSYVLSGHCVVGESVGDGDDVLSELSPGVLTITEGTSSPVYIGIGIGGIPTALAIGVGVSQNVCKPTPQSE